MNDLNALIKRWQAGDEWAAAAIYNHYRGTVYGLAYGLLSDAADAEEVAQDTLTYALTQINKYDPHKARFTTWLHTITVSRCRNKRRRRWLPGIPLLVWLKRGFDIADSEPGLENQTIQADTRNEVWQAIQTLSHPLREAILLRYWADYSYPEMGEILGCSARAARGRVQSAYESLKPLLSQSSLNNFAEKAQ